MEGEEGREEGL